MALVGILTLAAVLCGLFMLQRMRAAGGSKNVTPPADASVFPISALDARWGMLGNMRLRHTSATSITIDADGLHFQAMGPRHLAFTAIQNVELVRKWNGPALLFIGREWGNRLTLTLADENGVRSILRALPGNIPLSPNASALRGPESVS